MVRWRQAQGHHRKTLTRPHTFAPPLLYLPPILATTFSFGARKPHLSSTPTALHPWSLYLHSPQVLRSLSSYLFLGCGNFLHSIFSQSDFYQFHLPVIPLVKRIEAKWVLMRKRLHDASFIFGVRPSASLSSFRHCFYAGGPCELGRTETSAWAST